jgi:BMFP domain-containing protein YqiC
MTVSELIQQQRYVLCALHNAVRQYQQQIAEAQKLLEHALERIQTERSAAEQEAKREYEQARDKCITAILNIKLPIQNREDIESQRKQLQAKMLSDIEAKMSKALNSTLVCELDNISLIRDRIQEVSKRSIGSEKIGFKASIPLIFSFLIASYIILSFLSNSESIARCTIMFFLLIIAMLLMIRDKYNKLVLIKRSQDIEYLISAYQSWLKLVTQNFEKQSFEARQAYQQVVEQVKQQFSNNLQQLRPTVLDYTTLANQTSPPWQSEAWQNWKPGTLTPGVVRLGVFTLQPDQLESNTNSQR